MLQAEEIQQLKDEIARLKGQKPKPRIRPSTLEKTPKDQERKDPSGKRPGSDKRSKTSEIIIHETIPIAPEFIPPGSTFKGYQPYTHCHVTQPLLLEQLWETWMIPGYGMMEKMATVPI